MGNAQLDLSISTSLVHATASLTDAFSSNGEKGTSLVKLLVVVNALGVGSAIQLVLVTKIMRHA